MNGMPYKKIFTFFFVLAAVGTLVVIQKEPRNDREWMLGYEKTATAEVSTNSVTINDVRDWTHGIGETFSMGWTKTTVDLRDIARTWFIIEPFGPYGGIGHTFLSFEFKDGSTLAFSIQSRHEVGERYSPFLGLLNAYELEYQWGTERDLVGARVLKLEHEIRMYPLTISEEDSKNLFLSLVEETNTLAKEPRFYNTLTANCTNLLAKTVNKYNPGVLPYDISWNLTGYSDLYLMEKGFIEDGGDPSSARSAADLTPYRDEISGWGVLPAKEFSTSIRELLLK